MNDCKKCGYDMGEAYVNCGASEDGTCPECGYIHNPYVNHPRQSDKNKAVLDNFILHMTHKSREDKSSQVLKPWSSNIFYSIVDEYIQEDHVDGRENEDDMINQYYGESSWDGMDKDKEYPEMYDVVVDRGENHGTETICSFDIDNKDSAECLIEHLNGVQS